MLPAGPLVALERLEQRSKIQANLKIKNDLHDHQSLCARKDAA
jgi:hypothetical protein